MSYDVTIGDFESNMTSNVAKLFYDHIPDTGKGGGLHELHGMTGAQCVEILCEAFDRINSTRHKLWKNGTVGEPEFCALYDAQNGWGSTVGALTFLAQILGGCARNRRHKLRLSA